VIIVDNVRNMKVIAFCNEHCMLPEMCIIVICCQYLSNEIDPHIFQVFPCFPYVLRNCWNFPALTLALKALPRVASNLKELMEGGSDAKLCKG
jgi:hypothetical protein